MNPDIALARQRIHPSWDLIAAMAAQQFGVLSVAQLMECGMSHKTAAGHVRAGRLQRVHHGVYLYGIMTRDARCMAAILAAGGLSALAWAAAADRYGVWRWGAPEISVVADRRLHRLRDIGVAYSNTLVREDVTRLRGMPITTLPRTIVDLADVLDSYQLAWVMHEAAFRRPLNVRALHRVMARNAERPGHGVVERALALHLAGDPGTRSTLEERLMEALEAAGVELPEINARVVVHGTTLEVDCTWPSRPDLVVEVDGPPHLRPTSKRKDEERSKLLVAAGMRVVRIVESEIRDRGGRAAVERVRAALAAPPRRVLS